MAQVSVAISLRMEAFLTILIWGVGMFLAAQAFVGLGFFISSIHEKEPRATFWGFLYKIGLS